MNNASSRKPSKNRPDPKESLLLQVLTRGLASLVEGQCGFADEFGLSYSRVFFDEFESFKGRETSDVIKEWLCSGPAGAEKINNLLDDLIRHQLALFHALDGIALETLDNLRPPKVVNRIGIRPPMQGSYRKLHDEFINNPNLRYAKIVQPGFVSAYMNARESKNHKLNQPRG